MTTVERFGYDGDRSQPLVAVEMAPTRTPFADLDLRFDVLNRESEKAGTLFAVYDGNERIYYLDHLWGAVLFVDDILRAWGYTVEAHHGPGLRSTASIPVSERELKHLADVRYYMARGCDR